jgi:predicted glycoside hydrolase/deacetylase ChbG (UPF0249 family)
VVVAHLHGIVTSTSILGNATDVAALVVELRALPRLGTGVLCSLAGGRPIAQPTAVSSLLAPDGSLLATAADVALAWAKAALRRDDIERELDAQVARIRDHGIEVDHLATADTLACLPDVAKAMETVARRHAIAGLRIAAERPSLGWITQPSRGFMTAGIGALAWLSRRQLGARRHGPQTWGMFERGHLDEIRILEILGRLGPGTHELVCEPEVDPAAPLPADGGLASLGGEIAGLCSPRVRDGIARRQVELCRWSDLF